MNFLENISLKPFNTFGVEVKARYFAEINSEQDILQLIDNQLFKSLNKLILGEGSDILFTKDFEGLVLKDAIKGIGLMHEDENNVWIKAGSGENWHSFVEYCVNQNWGGIENLALIPGTVGASPIQNIGAYGAEVKNSIHSLEIIDLLTGKKRLMMNDECRFGYRWSIFKEKEWRNRYYIVSVSFMLDKNPILNTEYQDIKDELCTENPTIQDVFNAVVSIRRRKLPDPQVLGNAGSFFKNPVVSYEKYEKLLQKYPDLKGFETRYAIKLAAAQLIEKCGWKGVVENNTGVYHNQALVIVNYGGASGSDILRFAQKIQESVYQTFGIELIPEVNIY